MKKEKENREIEGKSGEDARARARATKLDSRGKTAERVSGGREKDRGMKVYSAVCSDIHHGGANVQFRRCNRFHPLYPAIGRLV